MLEARTVGFSIARPWKEVYEAVWRPEDFPEWASGLSASPLVPNGAGAEVLVTVFRRSGMSDEAFAADAAWVPRDLLALKALLTP